MMCAGYEQGEQDSCQVSSHENSGTFPSFVEAPGIFGSFTNIIGFEECLEVLYCVTHKPVKPVFLNIGDL